MLIQYLIDIFMNSRKMKSKFTDEIINEYLSVL